MYKLEQELEVETGNLNGQLSSNELDLLKLGYNQYQELAAMVVGEMDIDEILSANNKKVYLSIKDEVSEAVPVNAAKIVIVLKATRLCNLRCTYCHSWAEGPGNSMSFETLARSIKQILAVPNVKRFEFVWHGGEVTMLKTTFFKKMIWLQQKFKREDQVISNSVQSNAVNLSDEWLTFLKGMGLSLGISMDGIPRVNDKRRVDLNGKGSSQLVVEGIKKLRERDIQYGAMVVVDRDVAETDPEEFFEYFIGIGMTDIDFLNIVPDNRAQSSKDVDESYINYSEFIDFLVQYFEVWWDKYRDKISVDFFHDFVNKIEKPESDMIACYWAGGCSQEVITLEANGDVSPCDKYVGDEGSIYGSLLIEPLANLLKKSQHNKSSILEEIKAHDRMKKCEWFSICNGGCPHDRVINSRLVPNYSGECCGTGKLIQVISDRVNAPSSQATLN